ncbi:MAG: hypothetical protein LBP80_08755 [Treponema sp.]|jgi:hypothetical protein|nr:hypothetical protein [Treponema sp.]
MIRIEEILTSGSNKSNKFLGQYPFPPSFFDCEPLVRRTFGSIRLRGGIFFRNIADFSGFFDAEKASALAPDSISGPLTLAVIYGRVFS